MPEESWLERRKRQMSPWRRFYWIVLYGGVWLPLCDRLAYARDWVFDRPENVWGDGPAGESTEHLGYRGTRTGRRIYPEEGPDW